ncbi:MAG: hypothetical protein V4592_25165 [Bacteroidota bacterium]
MKKMILAAAALAIVGITKVKASSVIPNSQPIVATAQQDTVQKTPVKLEDLPAPVKATLQGDVLKVWTPTAATLVKSGTTEYYQINIKKEADEKFVKIDKDGKIVQ